MCKHYFRWYGTGSTEARKRPTCAVVDCERSAHYSTGWCELHTRRWRKRTMQGSAGKRERDERIGRLRMEGVSRSKIAADCGCSVTTIHRVLSR